MPHRRKAEPPAARTHPHPPIALALGGGGARGLAHIVVLEVFDELGLRPAIIAGTSMGAVVGAAYAAGMPGRDIRHFAMETLRDRNRAMARALQARVGRLADIFSRGLSANPVLLDAEKLLDLFWPEAVPDTFEDLAIPLVAAATDYHAREVRVFDRGPLVTGVGASIAIPGLIQPVLAEGRIYVDGGVMSPLPFDVLGGSGELVIAVDVSGGPTGGADQVPGAFEAMLGAAQIMQHALVAQRLESAAPDVLVRPAVGGFRALDFFKSRAILQAAEAAREDLKRDLDKAIETVERRSIAARRKSS